jgi:hypothetical protein
VLLEEWQHTVIEQIGRRDGRLGDRRSVEARSYLTADSQMTRKPNLALNAEIESRAEGVAQTARD